MRHKFLWDFNIQTDHLISARRSDLIIINKKENLQNCELCCPGSPQEKLTESEKTDKYFDLARKFKKLWKMKVTVIPIIIGVLGTVSKVLIKRMDDLEMRTRGDHPNYCVTEIGQNTKKSPGDLRRLAVT